jgi:hypothetical protein
MGREVVPGHRTLGWTLPRTAAAAEFLDELSRHRQPASRPLPIEYRPLATAIVGERQPVRVSTSHASRRALARVGKRAATTGDTIHLDRPRPTPEVIAHELTHVAHPSPTPRFFDDDDRGPEERQAEQVAAVMRRSPILPTTSAAATRNRPTTAPTATTATTATIAPTSTPTTTRAPGTISASALAASITGNTSSGAVQRKQVVTPAAPAPTAPDTIRRADDAPTTAPTIPTSPASSTGESDPLDQPALRANPAATRAQFELILELLEERILAQLERRGGRYRGGF